MGTEDRHDEDLFPPEPSRESASSGPEGPEEEEFFVLEEEEGEGMGGESSGEKSAGGEEEVPSAPPPARAEAAGVPEPGMDPSAGDFPVGEVDESLFEEMEPPPGTGSEGEEVFVQEFPGAGDGAPSPGEAAGAEPEESTGEGPGEDLEDLLFEDLEKEGTREEEFGVDLPRFHEGEGGEEELLEALEDFDPEEVHDAPREGAGTPGELEDLGLDLDLETDLELVDDLEDLVAPSPAEEGAPGGDEAVELDLGEEGPGIGPDRDTREEPLVLDEGEADSADENTGLDLEGEGTIDESLFEEEEGPGESPGGEIPLAAASSGDGAAGEGGGEDLFDEETSSPAGEEPLPSFHAGDAVEEETPANPLLSSFEEEPGAGGGEEGSAGGSGVAPWMVPEEVLEETPEGLAAAPTEDALLGEGREEEDLPEIGLRPLEEEEEPYPGEEGDLESQEETAQGEPPTFEELYGLPGPAGDGEGGTGEVETSDSLLVEGPKVTGGLYQEETHGWGVRLILWGSLAASLAVGAFVGWVYMKQKAALHGQGVHYTAMVEMPKPVLADHAPPPDLRPKESTAWKPFRGEGDAPPPSASKVARTVGGRKAPEGAGGPEGPVRPAPGPERKPGKGEVASGAGPAAPPKQEKSKPAPTLVPLETARGKPSPSHPGGRKPSGEKERPSPGGLAQGKGTPAGPGPAQAGPAAPPAAPPSGQLARAGGGGETPVPLEPSGQVQPPGPGGQAQQPPAAPPASSGRAGERPGWKDALGLVRGTQVLAELRNGNYFIGRIYKIGGRKVVLDVKKGQLTFYYDEVAHLMPIGPALARKLKEHPSGFVILKNTNRLKGEIVVEAKDYVTIQVREARITIPRESIERVEKGKETSLKLKDDPVLAKELGMDDLPAEEEKPQARPAPVLRREASIPSGAVEELDRLLGAARPKGDKNKKEKVLTLPAAKEGEVKVRAGG